MLWHPQSEEVRETHLVLLSAHWRQVSLSLSLSLRRQEDFCPPTAPEVAVRNVSLVPLCPPSLMVVWGLVEPSLLNGPAQESVYVIVWEEREGQGNGMVKVDYSDTTTVSPDIPRANLEESSPLPLSRVDW